MIEFVTLLLGLVAGVQTAEVIVDDRVARVEIQLDGDTIAMLEDSPWLVDRDFGGLAPHRLVAVAWDSRGRETGRTSQWVNLPRRRTEVRLGVSRSADGTATARLIYSALDFATPKSIEVTLDGKRLEFEDPLHIELPDSDPGSVHFLRAQLELPNETKARAELVFGGLYSEEVTSELTAILLASDGRAPKPKDVRGWLAKNGQPLEVVAVEKGSVKLFFIREKSTATHNALTEIARRLNRDRAKTGGLQRPRTVLQKRDRLRFVFPAVEREQQVVGQGAAPIVVEQVDVSPNAAEAGPLAYVLTQSFFSDQPFTRTHEGIADAVAIAGLVAAGTDRRSAVVLIRTGISVDTSRHTSKTASDYLALLGIPLRVWSLRAEGGRPSPWIGDHEVSDLRGMNQALQDLGDLLKPQIVVWVRGAHLPQEIELTDRAGKLRKIG